MGRKLGSKNKNINTAKNKNVININVNSSTSRKGRGRPRKQSNDTTQTRQYGGGGGMAPPQVIISQPTPQQDNSLLSSFITSRMLNESNMLNSRTSMPSMVEPPTGRELPSYFSARESIITKLPETPIKEPVIKPADITPSSKIKTKEPIPEPEPRKIDVKPDEVAPPTTGRHLYKKLKDTASTVADAASSELGTAIIESALNGIDKTHVASSLVGTALRAHRNRKENAVDADEEIKQNEIKQLRQLHKNKNKTDAENALFNTLKTKYTGVQPRPPKNIKQMNDAATSIQLAVKNRKARNEFADKYVDKLKDEYAKGKAGAHIRSAVRAKLYSKEIKDLLEETRAKDKIVSAIQSKQYSNERKQVLAVHKNLGPAIKQAVTRNKYTKARDKYYDKKEGNKLDTMEAQVGYIENVVKKARDIKEKQSKDTLSNAIKSRKARQDYKEAVDTYNPATHQANIRDKRKEFARIITTKTTSPQAKEDAQKQFKKTNYVFKRKSNAGRPPNQPSK
jgi:hypothetical protein